MQKKKKKKKKAKNVNPKLLKTKNGKTMLYVIIKMCCM